MKTIIATIGILAMLSLSALAEEPKLVDSVEFRGTVDIVHIKLQENKLWLERYVGDPVRLAINSRTFNPKWQGHRSEVYTKFPGKFKPFAGCVFTIEVREGRSVVDIVEQPSEANKWTLTVKISDQPNDSDKYRIIIHW